MGSRSKFHKSVKATTPGRELLHGPRPKKPIVVKFADAFVESIQARREALASGDPKKIKAATPAPRDLSAVGRLPRAVRRAEAFMSARIALAQKSRSKKSRAERRAAAFDTARAVTKEISHVAE